MKGFHEQSVKVGGYLMLTESLRRRLTERIGTTDTFFYGDAARSASIVARVSVQGYFSIFGAVLFRDLFV